MSLKSSPAATTPDLSMVIPCYNEEDTVAYTVHRLLGAFERAGYRLELVTVDNGSSDGTGTILRELAGREARSFITASTRTRDMDTAF